MYKISELIGKQSITLLDAESRGIVFSAYFDKGLTKLKHLLLLGGDEETEFLVDYKSLSSIHSDAVVISSAAAIRPAPATVEGAESPINLPAFNQDGKSLGFIRDIIMEDNKVNAFVTDGGEIPAGTLLSRSEIMVVFNDTGAPIKLLRPKKSGHQSSPRAKSCAHSDEDSSAINKTTVKGFISVSAGRLEDSAYYDDLIANDLANNPDNDSAKNLRKTDNKNYSKNAKKTAYADGKNSDKNHSENSISAADGFPFMQSDILPENADRQVGTPQKITPQHAVPPISDISLLKYAFLLDKRLCRSIYTSEGSLVARENDLVTESVIKRAKENGKLVAVALHSL